MHVLAGHKKLMKIEEIFWEQARLVNGSQSNICHLCFRETETERCLVVFWEKLARSERIMRH